ncbi:MAG: prephenate dehydratase [Bacillota bacterium]
MSRYAVLGPPGTYSEDAAWCYWKEPRGLIYASEISQVFDLVAEGKADEGLVPIYNSLAGTVGVTMNNLLRHELYIGGEYVLPVRHCLMAREVIDLTEVEVVISQPEAFLQCQGFLARRLPNARREIVNSTGQAASYIRQEKRKAAAIGSHRAAEVYGLYVIASNLEDDMENRTTFISIRKAPLTRGDKTSILFGLEDLPGSLYRALEVFAKREVNLSRLESRPRTGTNHDYVFYADVEGGSEDSRILGALRELSSKVAYFRYLGSYSRYQYRTNDYIS